MAERTIRHAQFAYSVETPAYNKETGEQITRLVKRIALQGATVDIPRAEDIERGEAAGAFVTEEEEAEEESEQVAVELDFSSHDQLVEWIRDEKPTAAQVVATAGDDPDNALALMDAEEEASGGQPRKNVMSALQKIADK